MKFRHCMLKVFVFLLFLGIGPWQPLHGQQPTGQRNGLIQLALVMDRSHGYRYRNSELDADILASTTRAFVSSKQFAMIERVNLQAILAEKDLEDFIQSTRAGGLTDLEGIDMIGIVSYEVERRPTGEYFRISVQLTDTKTGRINSTLTSDRDTFGQPTSPFIAGKNLHQNIKERFAAGGWVIETAGEIIVVDLGSEDGIERGDEIEVYQVGEPIIHPVTGELLPGIDTTIARLKVTKVHPRISNCKIKDRGAFVQEGDRARLAEKDGKMDRILGKIWRHGRKNGRR